MSDKMYQEEWSRRLTDLTDVDAPTPADGDTVVFDAARGLWKPAAPPEAGSVPTVDVVLGGSTDDIGPFFWGGKLPLIDFGDGALSATMPGPTAFSTPAGLQSVLHTLSFMVIVPAGLPALQLTWMFFVIDLTGTNWIRIDSIDPVVLVEGPNVIAIDDTNAEPSGAVGGSDLSFTAAGAVETAAGGAFIVTSQFNVGTPQ